MLSRHESVPFSRKSCFFFFLQCLSCGIVGIEGFGFINGRTPGCGGVGRGRLLFLLAASKINCFDFD